MNTTWMAMGAGAGLLLLLLWVLTKCFFRVGEGNLGVRVTFGAAETLSGDKRRVRTWGPGLHGKMPWHHVIVVPVMEQSVDLSGEKGRTAMAADGTKLRFDSILRYQPVEERLGDYLFGMRAPREHVTGLFTCLLRNEIANFGADGTPGTDKNAKDPKSNVSTLLAPQRDGVAGSDDMGSFALLRRERAQLNKNIATFCHGKIDDRYGLVFNAVDLVDILPPDELASALNAVIHAHTEAGARYFRAEGDSQQRVLAAEEGLAIARTRADAAYREMTTLAEYLTDLDKQGTLDFYVARRRAEVLGDARATYFHAGKS